MASDYISNMLAIQQTSGENQNTGWQGFNRNLRNIGEQLGEYARYERRREQDYARYERKRKQDMEDALMMITLKAQAQRLANEGNPLYQSLIGYMDKYSQGKSNVIDTTGQVVDEQGQEIVLPERELVPSFNIGEGGITMSLKPELTPQAQLRQKIKEQGAVASEKAKQLSQEKLQRFIPLRKVIEEKWLETEPYKAKDIGVKVGAMPLLGIWDISKKWLQVTKAQRKDKAYADFVGALRARIARSLGEDVGNLSEYEQSAILTATPVLMDVYETGKDKLKNLDDLILEIQKARKEGKTLEEYKGINSTPTSDINILNKLGLDPNKYELVK